MIFCYVKDEKSLEEEVKFLFAKNLERTIVETVAVKSIISENVNLKLLALLVG